MPATLTSILSGDLISASRAVINTNYQNLQTAKADLTSPSLIGVPNAITGAYQNDSKMVATNEFVQQAISSVTSAGNAVTLVPKPGIGTNETNITNLNLNNSSVMHLGQVLVPLQITVNQLGIYTGTVTTAGSVLVGIYSENGNTKHIDVSVGVNTSNEPFW